MVRPDEFIVWWCFFTLLVFVAWSLKLFVWCRVERRMPAAGSTARFGLMPDKLPAAAGAPHKASGGDDSDNDADDDDDDDGDGDDDGHDEVLANV